MGNIIIERRKDLYHTTISTAILRDKDISIKAKGLYAIIMSLPDSWDLSTEGLISIVKEGSSLIRSAINELIEAGYCIRERERNDDGTMSRTKYVVLEQSEPHSGFPHVDNPHVDNPHVEKQRQSINRIRTDRTRTNRIKKEKSVAAYLRLRDGNLADLSAYGELAPAVDKWLRYKYDIAPTKRYAYQSSVDKVYNDLLSFSNGDPDTADAVVQQSIDNSWTGIYALKTARHNNGNNNGTVSDQQWEDMLRRVAQREGRL